MSVPLRGKVFGGVFVRGLWSAWRVWCGGRRAFRCRDRALWSLDFAKGACGLVFFFFGFVCVYVGMCVRGRERGGGRGKRACIRCLEPRFQFLVARFQGADFLLQGLGARGLLLGFGEEEGDFLVEGAEVGFCFVGFDVGGHCLFTGVVDWGWRGVGGQWFFTKNGLGGRARWG